MNRRDILQQVFEKTYNGADQPQPLNNLSFGSFQSISRFQQMQNSEDQLKIQQSKEQKQLLSFENNQQLERFTNFGGTPTQNIHYFHNTPFENTQSLFSQPMKLFGSLDNINSKQSSSINYNHQLQSSQQQLNTLSNTNPSFQQFPQNSLVAIMSNPFIGQPSTNQSQSFIPPSSSMSFPFYSSQSSVPSQAQLLPALSQPQQQFNQKVPAVGYGVYGLGHASPQQMLPHAEQKNQFCGNSSSNQSNTPADLSKTTGSTILNQLHQSGTGYTNNFPFSQTLQSVTEGQGEVPPMRERSVPIFSERSEDCHEKARECASERTTTARQVKLDPNKFEIQETLASEQQQALDKNHQIHKGKKVTSIENLKKFGGSDAPLENESSEQRSICGQSFQPYQDEGRKAKILDRDELNNPSENQVVPDGKSPLPSSNHSLYSQQLDTGFSANFNQRKRAKVFPKSHPHRMQQVESSPEVVRGRRWPPKQEHSYTQEMFPIKKYKQIDEGLRGSVLGQTAIHSANISVQGTGEGGDTKSLKEWPLERGKKQILTRGDELKQVKELAVCNNFFLSSMSENFQLQERMIDNMKRKQDLEAFLLRETLHEVRSLRKDVDEMILQTTDIQGQSGLLDYMRGRLNELVRGNPSLLLDHEGKQLDSHAVFFSKYELVLQEGDFSEPLVKDKNFVVGIVMQDIATKQNIANIQPIPVRLRLYTYNNPPNIFESDYIKGQLSSSILRGNCAFRKIHIKHVTSHQKNRAMFLVVEPDIHPVFLPHETTTSHRAKHDFVPITLHKESLHSDLTKKRQIRKKKDLKQAPSNKQDQDTLVSYPINPILIKPLILEQIIVKSKNNILSKA